MARGTYPEGSQSDPEDEEEEGTYAVKGCPMRVAEWLYRVEAAECAEWMNILLECLDDGECC